MRSLICAALIAAMPCLASCSPQETPARNKNTLVGDSTSMSVPAVPVPTHVLTKERAHSRTLAEQGDVIEVRLAEPVSSTGTWQWLRQMGSGHVEVIGPVTLLRDQRGTQRVFRFRAMRIGTLALVFVFQAPNKTPRSEEVVAFNFTIQ